MQKRKLSFITLMLLPISWLYGTATSIRNLLFDWGILHEKHFDLPVISVGNITVGGTGKTPHVEYLVEQLKNAFNVAVLSRGYKRKTRHFLIASSDSTASEIGDEPRQLKQKYPEIVVAVDRKRVNGIEQLSKLANQVDIVLLDDAFQHRYVRPGKSILLIDYNNMITEDKFLPAGRLREAVSGKKRADIILITKSPLKMKPMEMRNIVKQLNLDLHQHLFFTTIEYGKLIPVFNDGNVEADISGRDKKTPLLIVSGIANPRPIRRFARTISTALHELKFPDHHAYTMNDLEKIKTRYLTLNHPDAIILTTEKDAIRLQELEIDEQLKKAMFYVPIKVGFLNNDADEFNKLIHNYVSSNKRNNILYQRKDKTKS